MRPTAPTPSAASIAAKGARSADRYVVQKELASGGMGAVFQVLDRLTGEQRALKRVSLNTDRSGAAIEALKREYQVLASLDHPRIIRVFDYGIDESGPYYTMELLDGQDLRQAAPVPYRQACRYLRDVATSIALLHARRLLHRDLSPSNVRIAADGHCKLLDFGALSPFGFTPVIVGTPPFVAPEALAGASLDQRADLYSLGALAYWMLTGRHAFSVRRMDELPDAWLKPPPPPSARVHGIPESLDTLVLSLLRKDPLARPASAAEVIARLNVIGELSAEKTGEAELADSFLLNPRFTGREKELNELQSATDGALRGHGDAIRIEAASGMGRTRLLEEVGVRAQLSGATVVRVDASMYRQLHGASRAIVLRLFEALPARAREIGVRYRHNLSALGSEVADRLPAQSTQPPKVERDGKPEIARPLDGFVVEIARTRPLVLEIDNVEYADDSSLGFVAALARICREHPILVVVTERTQREEGSRVGLDALRHHSRRIELAGLRSEETLELVRSLFGDAPNVQRFAEWLHDRTAGSPLHAVEIARQLVAKQVIRYSGGLWTLPLDRPDAELNAALGDALSIRIAALGADARALAECLSLQRESPTFKLCRLLSDGADDREVLLRLDELARTDVLYPEADGYRFSSTAVREALLAEMNLDTLEDNHKRLGLAFEKLAGQENPNLRIEAGWHLIQGGEELRGADLIANVACDPFTVRTAIANLHRIGQPVEAALQAYARHRRSVYERTPLLAALAQAGYYEERTWGERYGDQALDALEDLTGLRTARRLRRFCGRRLGLVLGILAAFVRFVLTPRRERKYSFATLIIQLLGAVTTLTAAAALSFDENKAASIAEILEPFSVLPERLTPRGIYEFCKSLREITRDNEAVAYRTFETLRQQFENPRYYPTLPDDGRKLYVAAAHFARGSFATMSTDGQAALESADALDATGLKLYATIASQLRFLYHMNRGEFAAAAPHREQMEVNAAHVGSIWQVETWEAAALILVHTSLSDVVGATHVARRLDMLSRTVPSLKRHARLARQALLLAGGDMSYTVEVDAEYSMMEPRSFIGWGATQAFLARGYNETGQHAEAKAVCERTLAHLRDEDREFVSHFLVLEIEAAIADAHLGRVADALSRIDALLERFAAIHHPLVHGLLHEARARISWLAGDAIAYRRSLTEVQRWFRPTENPVLIAKCERLARLGEPTTTRRQSDPPPLGALETVREIGSESNTQTVVEKVG